MSKILEGEGKLKNTTEVMHVFKVQTGNMTVPLGGRRLEPKKKKKNQYSNSNYMI